MAAIPSSPDRPSAHPIDELTQDHALIHRVLGAIDDEAAWLQSSFEVRLGFWLQALDFLEHFADDEHHGKEDHWLWPALEHVGVSREHGPLAHLGRDYEQGRIARGCMVEALAHQDVPGLARSALLCARQLRRQIEKEEQVLFPLAFELLDPCCMDRLRREFDQQNAELGSEQRRRMHDLAVLLVAASRTRLT